MTFGSWTKALPEAEPGGAWPVVPNLRHSMTCVARVSRGRDHVRTAPKSDKKTPTTSSDRGDARRWRQNNGTPRRTVVLPHPFAPTIIVSGLSNSMACSLSGEKARMPLMANFSIWDMASLRRTRAALALV